MIYINTYTIFMVFNNKKFLLDHHILLFRFLGYDINVDSISVFLLLHFDFLTN